MRYQQKQNVLWRRSLDRLIATPASGGEITILEGSGAAVWEALAEPATVHQLSDSFAAAYSVDAGTVANDLEPVLAELVERGLVEEVPG